MFYDIDIQRTHNLVYLLDLLSNKIEIDDNTYDKAVLLNGYSVQIRYPDKSIYLTKDELEIAINTAQNFRAIAVAALGLSE